MTDPDAPGPDAVEPTARAGWLTRLDWRAKARWLAAEIVIVVAGVLIAFAVNAAWEGRKRDALEAVVLRSVAAEFDANRAALERVIAYTDGCLEASDAFVRSGPDRLSDASPERVVETVERLACPATFDPTLAAAQALAGATGLSSVRDLMVRQAVAGWLTDLEDAAEEAQMVRDSGLEVLDAVAPYAARGSAGGVPGFPTVPQMVAAGPSGALADLRRDPAVVEAVILRSNHQHLYRDGLADALAQADSVQAMIAALL